MLKKEWIKQGFIDEPVAEGTDLKAEIRKMCQEKDAIILAHYYTIGDIHHSSSSQNRLPCFCF